MNKQQVNFRIRDVYLPEPAQILLELKGDDLLSGEVLDLTAGGEPEQAFAVVQVDGINRLLLVPLVALSAAKTHGVQPLGCPGLLKSDFQ